MSVPGWSIDGIDNAAFIRMMTIRLTKGYELSVEETMRLFHLARAYVVWKEPALPLGSMERFLNQTLKVSDVLNAAMTERPNYAKAISEGSKKYVADWQAKEPRAPIFLKFAMNIMFSGERAEADLGTNHWNSPAGKRVRMWLLKEGLVIANEHYKRYPQKIGGSVNVWQKVTYEITDKGRAWVEHACGTPLPVERTETITTKKWTRG